MTTDESRALVRYLASVSRTGLGSFQLNHMNRAANLEREIRERLELLVEDLAMVELAQFLREHGEELAEALGAPRLKRSD
jgi:hypothetical protein